MAPQSDNVEHARDELSGEAEKSSAAAQSPRALRAVVFDLDGLMFNTEDLYQEVGATILARRGKTWTAELLDAMMGRPGRESLRIMIDWHSMECTVEDLSRETDEIFADILPHRLSTMPGLLELLDALETVPLDKAIATSSGRAFLEEVLGRFSLLPRFRFALTAEDVVQGKPEPEIYLTAARRLELTPAQMMVLEDSQNGCRAAVRAGAFAVAVPGGPSLRHDFTGARFVAESLHDPRIYAALGLQQPATIAARRSS